MIPQLHPPGSTRRALRLALTAVLLGMLGSAVLPADTVWLNNGRSLEGRAVVRADGDVELHSTMGVVRVPGHTVDRIERSQSIEDRVAARLDSLGSVSADDLYELGTEARLAGAYTLSERLLHEALRLDPDHEATRRALGFVRTADGWMLERLVQRPKESPRRDAGATEAAERIALLRALRAQSEASRLAELQRHQLLALEAQRLAEEEAAAAAAAAPDDFVVQTVIPIWSVPYGPGFHPKPRPPATAGPDGSQLVPRSTAPARRSVASERPQRRNTLVQGPRPNG